MSFIFQDLEIEKKKALWMPGVNWRRYPRGRLLVWLTYRFDSWVFDRRSEFWRMTNLAIHAFNALLVMAITARFAAPAIAITAAALFLAHPLTLMGSYYIAGRAGELCATVQFSVAALALHGHWISALLIAIIGSLFVKEDAVSCFPILVAIWFAR